MRLLASLHFLLILAVPAFGQDSFYQNEAYNAPYRAMVAAYTGLDSAGIAAVYASDATYARPSGPTVGRAAITQRLGGFLARTQQTGFKLTLSFALLHRSVAQGVVTDVGVYRLESSGPAGTRVGYGKFVTQSILEEGTYRFTLDTDRPLAPAVGAALFDKGTGLVVE